jgi:hypothetical protein
MKKQILLTIAACTITVALHAQKRNCGTMEYLEYRKMMNPALDQIMLEQEEIISRAVNKTAYPVLEGFTPAGTINDRAYYRAAKEKMLAGKPKSASAYSEAELTKMREEKRTRYYSIH